MGILDGLGEKFNNFVDNYELPPTGLLLQHLGETLSAADQGRAANLAPIYERFRLDEQTRRQNTAREQLRRRLLGGDDQPGILAGMNYSPEQRALIESMMDAGGEESVMGILGGALFPASVSPENRYRVVGDALLDLYAEGGPQSVYSGAPTGIPGFDAPGVREPVGAPRGAPMAPPAGAPVSGITPEIEAAWIAQESGGDPSIVSPRGAVGLTQIMPDTARDPGYGLPDIFTVAQSMGREVPDTSDATLQALLVDPDVNLAFGRAYLGKMLELNGGDLPTALAAYNAGPGAVEDAGGIPAFPETRNYVDTIMAAAGGPTGNGAPSAGGEAGTPRPVAAAPVDPSIVADETRERQLLEMLGDSRLTDNGRRRAEAELELIQERRRTRATAEAPRKADRAEGAAGTADMQNYNFYADQETAAGRTPKSFEEWRLTRPPRSPDATMTLPDGTVIQVGGDATADPTTLGREGAKADVALRTDWRTAADGAANLSSIADQALALIPELGYTGIGGSIYGTIRDTIGTEGTGARGAFERLTTEAQLQMSQLLKGAITDRENAMLRAATFSMDRQPEANQNIALAMKAAADRLVIRAEFGDRYLSENGSMDGAQAAWNRYINENPLFELREGTYVLFEPAPFDNYIPPAVGAVVDGHVFKGGDPADQNNWEPVDGR